MAKILVHLTHGMESPTQADRAFVIAKLSIEKGHTVSMFLGGSAVTLIKDENLDQVLGFKKPLRDHFEQIVNNGGKIYLNDFSVKNRGVTNEELKNKAVQLSSPEKLIDLAVEYDCMFTYG